MRGGGPEKDDGQVLATCKFDTLDADAFHQTDMKTHDDSDDSDGYSIDSDRYGRGSSIFNVFVNRDPRGTAGKETKGWNMISLPM